MDINDDSDFKAALSDFSPAQQRMVAARFAENVLELTKDARIKRAIDTAKLANISDEATHWSGSRGTGARAACDS